MKKLFLLFVAFVATTTLWAQSFRVGELYYNITSSSAPYTVEVSYAVSSITSAIIPESITHNGTTYSVTSIGEYAFEDCSSLTSITIPNSVTSIGGGAFDGCSSLKSITIPNSVTSIGSYAFQGCRSLTTITIPNSVTSIGYDAFHYCLSLTSITIPNSVTSIGGSAFQYCCSLTSITIPNSVTSIGDYAFMYCSRLTSITIGNSVKSIGGGAFSGCESLTSITIPNSVTSIGSSAFYDCSSLTTVTIPNSVTSIGDYTFKNCSRLTSITIPNSVTSIGGGAFYDCFRLTSVIIPNSVTSIGNKAFYMCISLTSMVVESSNTTYDSRDNCNAIIETATNTLIAGCKNTTIPNSVTSIGQRAFCDYGNLTSINIPNSVRSIGERAFYNCINLTSITCEAATPPRVGSDAFHNVSISIPVYVPCRCINAYKAVTGWENFTNIQGPLAEYSIEVNVNDTIMGTAKVDYNNDCTGNQISATANYGCHFVQWSDGNTDNPRSLELTQDTILTAEFAPFFSGQCGDNLYWVYDQANKTISITGSGDMYNYTAETQPWLLFKEELTEIHISNKATSIGTAAFQGCTRLSKVNIGTAMKNIAANAFANCNKLYDIYCYAAEPPTGYTSSFANYNAFLHVPCESQRLYMLDILFGEFKYIECISSDEVTTDDIVITPGTTDVTVTWPTEDNAYQYVIEIKKDSEVFCTLTFNSEGQLLNIAFAPGRDGTHSAQYAAETANGLRFTVTGLEEGTNYTYDVITKDKENNQLSAYSGEVTTYSNIPSDLENLDTQSPKTDCQKLLRDGQLLILKDDNVYTIMGQEIQ